MAPRLRRIRKINATRRPTTTATATPA
jgi:hypothetical protein